MVRRMNNRTSMYGLLAAGLVVFLVSCGGARHAAAPQRPEELTGFVLVIEDAADGQVRHSWRRASEFDLSRYNQLSGAGGAAESVVLASSRPRDCDQEHIACYQNCMKSRLPSNLSHLRREDGSKGRFCTSKCLGEYMDCLKLQGASPQEFHATEGAVEWLKQNRKQLAVGAIVVIAGVAFVTLSAGAGALVLAPLLLVGG